MKRLLGTIILLLILGNTINAVTDGISFNENWRFFKGEIKGAEAISFDDDSWRKLNLPHDWAIEGPFDSKYNARCGGLPFHGTGWYRYSSSVAVPRHRCRIHHEAPSKYVHR